MTIRVLVADDSATVRNEVSRWLSEEPGVEVVATAFNGRQAIERAAARHPDVVLLDVDMPDVDGLEALKRIRAEDPRVPIIMFSSHTQRGGATTLEALSLGASDYVLKPAADAPPQLVRAQLVEKIRRLHERRAPGPRAVAPVTLRASSPLRVDVVVVGSSTGGPNALDKLFRALPDDLPPILLVQHMPPLFTKSLAERLDRLSALDVREATPGALATRGTAWIAPGDWHMVARRRADGAELALHQGHPENSCRPSVDVLFRSAAQEFGRHVLGVVLTGMGQDGLLGAKAVCDAGGEVLAQDEATSVVWGMPGAIAQAGLASRVLPVEGLAAEIVGRAKGVGA